VLSTVTFQQVVDSTADVASVGVRPLVTPTNAVEKSLPSNGFPLPVSSRAPDGTDQADTVGTDSVPTSGTQHHALPAPVTPTMPGLPGPAGAPGCPGQSGPGSGGSGSPQIAASIPFSAQGVPAKVQRCDGDRAAALLTRCDEPGSSPD
jgi:hypothetical protein